MARSGIASWFPKTLAQAVTAIAPGCVPLLAAATGTVALPVAAGVACLGSLVWLTRWEGKLQTDETNDQLRDYFKYLLQAQASRKDEILAAIEAYTGEIPKELPLDDESVERLVSLGQAVQELHDKSTLDEASLAAAVEPLLAGTVDTQGLVAKSLLEIKDRFDDVDQALAEIQNDLITAADEIKGHVSAEHKQTRDHQSEIAKQVEAAIHGTPQAVVDRWRQLELAPSLVVPCLIGGWEDANQFDGQVLDRLIDGERGRFDEAMREAVQLPDAPIGIRDGVWQVPNRVGLWRAMGARIFDEHLERFREVALEVLSVHDPAFDLPREERWLANIKGKVLPHSHTLREGFIHTLALLGSEPDVLVRCAHGKPQDVAYVVIRDMLADADWQRWGSLNRLLPVLAEASPEAFLDAVENAIGKGPCPFEQLFSEEGAALMGSNHLTGLWWALEKLAWHGDYLVRVVSILGDLDSRDPGGNWINRPGNSLTTILCPWMPQTAAPLNKHAIAIRSVLEEAPHTGWKLLLKLLPGDHGVQSPTQRPTYRQWKVPDDSWRPDRKDVAVAYVQFIEIAVEVAQGNPGRLTDLIPRLGKLTKEGAETTVDHLLSDATEQFVAGDRLELWEALLKTLRHHDRHPKAEWRWSDELLDRLRQVEERLKPSDPVDFHRHLFVQWGRDLHSERGNYIEQERLLGERRDAAVDEVFKAGGVDAVLRLAKHADFPAHVGFSFARLGLYAEHQGRLLEWIGSGDKAIREFARGLLLAGINSGGWACLDGLGIEDWPVEHRLGLLCWLSFTPETWDRAERWLGEDSAKYWEVCTVNEYAHDGDLTPAVERLRQHDRPKQALACLHAMMDRESFKAEAVIDTLHEAAITEDSPPGQFAYHLEELIKRLQASEAVDQKRLREVEWAYLSLFDHERGIKPVALENALATDPAFYCELIRILYNPSDLDRPEVKMTQEAKQALARRTGELLHQWRTPPGTAADGSFDPVACAEWFDAARFSLDASGHLDVGLHTAGGVLVHVPVDPDGLWLNRGAATVLNRGDMAELRRGYVLGIANARGVHFVAPDGSCEDQLADEWRDKAEEIENVGFPRVATTLRGVSDDYRRQAERVRRSHEDRS